MRAVGHNRSVRILYSVVVSLPLLGVVADLGLALTGPQKKLPDVAQRPRHRAPPV